ncbi:MAG: bifunctional alpha,alpha-trehalose-phosphate synthase (UDP-forming)/trehalose-phosphatase [Aquificota bacterium]|jgi:trehalose 6-phosphate synthase/phosphatase|nr:MAG: bifunctional alpha,alpha-trehalose-phosphate synthase (UDP-forming)/trehalose-phosphatase [Aquificota bacterium]
MKLVIVANRLPYIVKSVEPLELQKSPGGLASGVHTFLKRASVGNWLWVGWAGSSLSKSSIEKIRNMPREKYNVLPVYIPERLMDRFYNGFCNKTLWPLFHSMPTLSSYERNAWESYLEVNRLFLKTLLEHTQLDSDTFLWIHDYHLMLLPALVREAMPYANIGFFLHIPFPPPEIFAQLPWRREVLEGLLGADLIGFHTYEYTTNFLRSLMNVLGIEHTMGELIYKDRVVKVGTFPMGIDFQLFNEFKGDEEKVKAIRETLGNKRIVFSVDRLDYTKGIYNRLLAFEDFLNRRKDWHGRVVMILNLVPSREGVEHYQRMKRQIEEKVAQINGAFGHIEWVPILYHYKSLPTEELIAYYRACDVILVTPIKDGMNLVAKEFVASRRDLRGVLVLSEFAGSGKELGEALLVNPNSVEELSKAIENALEMPEEEQENRLRIMQERLRRYDVLKWGMDFIESLKGAVSKRNMLKTRELNSRLLKKLKDMYKGAKKKILFIDYDGTLVPIAKRPSFAVPTQEVKELLRRLSGVENTRVVLISGRRKEELENWFGDLPIVIVAEHGCWVRRQGSDWEATCSMDNELRERVKTIMEVYVDRLPQSFLEEKNSTLAFHYRNADQEMASILVSSLVDELTALLSNTDMSLLLGNKVVEVRKSGINKGTVALSFLQEEDYDFVLAIGDDVTDENMFKVLPSNAVSIKVGTGSSFARYHVTSQQEALNLLKYLMSDD